VTDVRGEPRQRGAEFFLRQRPQVSDVLAVRLGAVGTESLRSVVIILIVFVVWLAPWMSIFTRLRVRRGLTVPSSTLWLPKTSYSCISMV